MPDDPTADPRAGAEALLERAEDALHRDSLPEAEALLRLLISRAAAADPLLIARARGRLAQVYAARGDAAGAAPLFEEALAAQRAAGDQLNEAVTLYNMAAMRAQEGDFRAAMVLMEQVIALEERSGHPDLESDRAVLEDYRARLAGGACAAPAPAQAVPTPPPDDHLIALIGQFLNAPDWEASRRVLEQTPDLLKPEVDLQMQGLIEAAALQNNDVLAHHLIQHRTLLRYVREEGIEAAFARLVAVPDEVLQSALMAFVGAGTWQESRRVLEGHPLLLSQEAQGLLERLARAALDQGDQETAYRLSLHLDLLRSAIELGYDAAFERIQHPPDEALAASIAAFVSAGDWPAARAYLDAHPELLTPEADNTFDALIQAALAVSDGARANLLILHRDLLRTVRQAGPDEAFRMVGGEDAPVGGAVVVNVVAHNTAAVLTAVPEKRGEWLAGVRELREEARQREDTGMIALLDAIERLLEGAAYASIRPALQGAYAAAWAQIGERLRSVQ